MLKYATEIKTQTSIANEERQPCEIYTRVMGYIRPKSEFNIGKQQECSERKYFKLESSNFFHDITA